MNVLKTICRTFTADRFSTEEYTTERLSADICFYKMFKIFSAEHLSAENISADRYSSDRFSE